MAKCPHCGKKLTSEEVAAILSALSKDTHSSEELPATRDLQAKPNGTVKGKKDD